jgi:hypothetical protein
MKELIVQDGIQFVDLQRLFLPRDDFFRTLRKTRPAGETDKIVSAGRGVSDRDFYIGLTCLLLAAMVFVLYALIGAQMAMSFD